MGWCTNGGIETRSVYVQYVSVISSHSYLGTCTYQTDLWTDHRVIYMLDLHAGTNVPLRSAHTWTPFHHPPQRGRCKSSFMICLHQLVTPYQQSKSRCGNIFFFFWLWVMASWWAASWLPFTLQLIHDQSSRGGLDRLHAILSHSVEELVLAIGGSNPAWGMVLHSGPTTYRNVF